MFSVFAHSNATHVVAVVLRLKILVFAKKKRATAQKALEAKTKAHVIPLGSLASPYKCPCTHTARMYIGLRGTPKGTAVKPKYILPGPTQNTLCGVKGFLLIGKYLCFENKGSGRIRENLWVDCGGGTLLPMN